MLKNVIRLRRLDESVEVPEAFIIDELENDISSSMPYEVGLVMPHVYELDQDEPKISTSTSTKIEQTVIVIEL